MFHQLSRQAAYLTKAHPGAQCRDNAISEGEAFQSVSAEMNKKFGCFRAVVYQPA